MQLEATRVPIRYRLRNGEELMLRPGVPMDVPDHAANQLLKKAPDKVRRVKITCPVTIEPALKPNGSPFSAIYWETGDGLIRGPAVPEFVAKSGDQFWIVTSFQGRPRWIDADRLRSQKAFEEQVSVREVELIQF
jgi:hypothetical protein